ncbi:ferrous iron transport protein B [bacterium]|nr:ferrous iron transport protein B [bacterium]
MRLAIAGNPNAGKTSIFNNLTGTIQSVGNYPGVTVEIKKGKKRWHDLDLEIIDLPGTYSLMPYSQEEIVARNFIIDDRPEVVIDVVDASNLERNLYLTVQLMEMGIPLVICLNMIDIANKQGIEIDYHKLSVLFGIPVVPTIGNKGKGMDELIEACVKTSKAKCTPRNVTYGHEVENEVMELANNIGVDDGFKKDLGDNYNQRWIAVKLLEEDVEVERIIKRSLSNSNVILKEVKKAIKRIDNHYNEPVSTIIAERRYGFASGAVKACVKKTELTRQELTSKIDAVVCNRFFGPLFLAGIIYTLFTVVFKLADEWKWIFGYTPTEAIDWIFQQISLSIHPLSTRIPVIYSLLNDGVLGGIGSVLSFVPLIAIMFFFIAILEDWGYIARIAFIMDRLMKVFGLQGKSILAMILAGGLGAGGCAVAGIMATRTLREEKDRLITILVTPFMNCGAKLPAYFMLIAAFFSESKAKMLFFLWLFSWFTALLAAFILRMFIFKGEQTPFIMELPPYHLPTLKGVLLHTKERLWSYMRKAATIILGVNLILWFMMYFPKLPQDKINSIKERVVSYESSPDGKSQHDLKEVFAKEKLLYSFAGKLGKLLAPVSKLAGFDWQTNVALIGGFAAKEVIVSTLGTAYSMGELDPEHAQPLSEKLSSDPAWSKIKAFALMIFILIYAPCFATLAVIKKETGSWKWAAFSTIYSTTLAFVIATVIYQGGMLLGL